MCRKAIDVITGTGSWRPQGYTGKRCLRPIVAGH